MNRMISKFKKYKFIYIALILSVAVCIFLRVYHFENNIFFEIDQARDYKIISKILQQGIGEFPLVGPKAGGTFFRLGPFFYILALISNLILGISIKAMVIPNLLFSIATVPLFYLFVREFFVRRISIYVIGLFSVSLFAIEYSRFSWNPNLIPFFLLLTFYALLKYSVKDIRHRMLWVGIMSFSSAAVMQLHTITLIGLPIVLVVYLIIIKPKIYIKEIFVFFTIFLLLFTPLIANDVLTKGENTKEFYNAIINRQDSNIRTTVLKQNFVNIYNFSQFYTIILSSQQILKPLDRLESSYGLRDLLNKNFKGKIFENNIIKFLLLTSVFLIVLTMLLYFLIKRKNNFYFEKYKEQYNFLILIIVWQLIFVILFYPLALKVDSRYFLAVLFIPFILVGFSFMLIEYYMKRFGQLIVMLFVIVLILLNLYNSIKWLVAIDSFSTNVEALNNEFILESYFIITKKQWDGIVNIINNELESKNYPAVYLGASPLHIRPLIYLVQINKKNNVQYIDKENINSEGIYFYLRETKKIKNNKILPRSIEKKFMIGNEYDFGTVTLLRLQPYEGKKLKTDKIQENNNRCYMLNIPLEERNTCKIKDLKNIYLLLNK